MGSEFWRTVQLAIEKDNWTARLVVVLGTTGASVLGAYTIATAR
ncbi:hypothetical protein ACGFSB_35935 [Streptomyces sp. NPDC048441]